MKTFRAPPVHRRPVAPALAIIIFLASLGLAPAPLASAAAPIWIEGESPASSTMNRHPWYDQVRKEELSGGDMISNFHKDKAGEAEYEVRVPEAGEHELWVRANPVAARLSWRLDGSPWNSIDMGGATGSINIAADGKVDLRFIAWAKAGKVKLKKGTCRIGFRMDSENNHHGFLDCFVLAKGPFEPRGALKPGESPPPAPGEEGWFAFAPPADPFGPTSGFDLRSLNEKAAGDGGWIAAKDGRFVHSRTGKPVRFWAVNGPPGGVRDPAELRRLARLLAKYGVNLVRLHGGIFDALGEPDPAKVRRAQAVVDAMKSEGIYSYFSIYFPLWMQPKPGTPWLEGYDGKTHPFAALFFNEAFQEKYRSWWKALLLTPREGGGKPLVEEPAVAGVEILNEDSYFFWTFSDRNIPDPQLRILEKRFGEWLVKRYGSLEKALDAWKGLKVARDAPGEGRMGFRPLWNMVNEKLERDRDTARFLAESQRRFYDDTVRFLRGIGVKGLIAASNWTTASAGVFGPLEKYTYAAGDLIDRHGYFSSVGKGPNSEWSIRDGHTYRDRSALRFDPEEAGKPRVFAHPVMDPSYAGKPSMISETTWCRPNRYRGEAPLFLGCYGALQGSDAIVHFALDGASWTVKPGFFMQPWTLMAPAMMGQFPAAALIYRRGLVKEADLLVELNLKLDDLLDLEGTPLPQDAALDELRLKDVPLGGPLAPGGIIDPLVHLAGRANVDFSAAGRPPRIADLSKFIDRGRKTVTSATGELALDWGKGVLRIDAPDAQGASGDLKAAGKIDLKDLSIECPLDAAHIVAVSLDGKPLASSKKILLQAFTEERPSGFRAEEAGNGTFKILSIGRDPWLVRRLAGTVHLKRPGAEKLRAQPLDHAGYPKGKASPAAEIPLAPETMYYRIEG
jgi:hypothetical protein